MALGAEKSSVQNPLIRYAVEAGWTHVKPDDAMLLRRGESSAIFHDVLASQIQRLNPGIVDPTRSEEIIRRISIIKPSIEGNHEAWEFLKGLKTVFVPEQKRERNIRLLDPENVEANAFHVTDEFVFTNGTWTIRPDIVFLINGIPIAVVETKAAHKAEGIEEALEQIRRYHREAPELMAVDQLHALTHLVRFIYGATWNLTRKNLYDWRDEAAQAEDFETLVKMFVAPRRVLRVLTEYILFTRKDDELSKVVLRPHQMRAAERVIVRAREAEKRRGLVWHTQGSGKTYTMITIARILIADPAFEHPTVLMIVDRNELESQLFKNLEELGLHDVPVAMTKKHLQELLEGGRRGLIVSMIHKFDGMPADIRPEKNIFVLVDEAHRSTGGDLGNYLMGALPNATYIGFTGTPIDKTAQGRGTFKVFGAEDPKGYLDKYSVRESIRDGTTVPLHYALAPSELRVDRDVLESEFLAKAETEGISDIDELNRILDRAVTLRTMLKTPERVSKVAAYIAKDFREKVEPLGYKAFVVAVDREACTLYKKALDEHLPSEYSQVVISPGFNDKEDLKRFHLSEDREKEIRKAFTKPDQLPKILIVTEKLLTGFDAPILYCMYLDKPMRDHVLLQAIARVNRPHEDKDGRSKPAGFILDFVGIFEKLERALAFDSEDVEGVVEGIDVLKERFENLMAEGRERFLPIARGKTGDKQVEAVLEAFRDKEERNKFYQYFRELEEVYEILSPDPFLRPFIDDYLELGRMYEILRAQYEHVSVDRSFMRKTEELVQRHTGSGEIRAPQKTYKLDAQGLEQIANEKRPETVKVFNLLKALHDLVEEHGHEAPYLISIGERAQQIADSFQERFASSHETLQKLEELVEEYADAEKERQVSGLSSEGFLVMWTLKRQSVAGADKIGKAAAEAFMRFPHWRTSAAQEKEVRIALYAALLDENMKADPANLVEHIITTLRRGNH